MFKALNSAEAPQFCHCRHFPILNYIGYVQSTWYLQLLYDQEYSFWKFFSLQWIQQTWFKWVAPVLLLPFLYYQVCTSEHTKLFTLTQQKMIFMTQGIYKFLWLWVSGSCWWGSRETQKIFHGLLLVMGRFLMSNITLCGCKNQYLPAISSHQPSYSLTERDQLISMRHSWFKSC